MIVEKLLGKLEKVLGGGAIEYRWYEAPLYRYTLEKEVSEVEVEGHMWKRDNDGDVVVTKINDSGWALATAYPFAGSNQAVKAVYGDGFDTVKRVSGVEEVHKEKIGETKWDIDVDVADGTIENINRETILV